MKDGPFPVAPLNAAHFRSSRNYKEGGARGGKLVSLLTDVEEELSCEITERCSLMMGNQCSSLTTVLLVGGECGHRHVN